MKIIKLFLLLQVVGLIYTDFIQAQENWKLVWQDDMQQNHWKERWFLDGEEAILKNEKEALYFASGEGEHYYAGHSVLWSKASFRDTLKISYDYMRVDTGKRDNVCILYLLAEGIGQHPFKKDIYQWRRLRRIPSMFLYFWGMRTAHISYATRRIGHDAYIRSRAYPMETGKTKWKELIVSPSYENEGLFIPQKWYHIEATKIGDKLTFLVKGQGKERCFTWQSKRYLPIHSGRVGFRQMWGRKSRYRNVKIYQKK